MQTRFGDPTLRAEQSIAFDGGFDQRLAGNRLLFGLTYFYTRLQRVIDFKGFRSFLTQLQILIHWDWNEQEAF